MPPTNDPVSSIEELDPEPQPAGRSLRVRELVLGAILLVVVLAWAGWQTWDQQVHSDNYRAGVEAEAAKHWDEALGHFQAASGYKDADARARNDAKLIADRNRHYDAAVAASGAHKWASALDELRSAREIQPDYRDTAALYPQVQQHVYADALQGVIATRTEAEPPGLYYRASSDWVYLPGSDRFSQVRSSGSADTVVYDVPGPAWQVGPPPTPVPANRTAPPGSPALSGRLLKAAHLLGDSIRLDTLNLNPEFYNYYVPGKSGVLAVRLYDDPNSAASVPVRSNMVSADVYFVPYSRELGLNVVQQAYRSQAVLDFSTSTDEVLYAVWSGNSLRSSTVEVWVSGPAGENKRQVYTHVGEILSAQLSPDGTQALLVTTEPLKSDPVQEQQKAVLVDLTGTQPEATEVLSTVASSQTVGNFIIRPVGISGVFLRYGANKGKVLLTQSGTALRLQVLDPSDPHKRMLALARVSGPAFVTWVWESPDRPEILAGGVQVPPGTAAQVTGKRVQFLATLQPANQTGATVSLPTDSMSDPSVIGVRDGTVVNGLSSFDLASGDPKGQATTVYAALAPGVGYTPNGPTPVIIFASTAPPAAGTASNPPAVSLHAGSSLLGYIQASALYARAYDGSSRVLLETGVPYLYDPYRQAGLLYELNQTP
jgi:hypothetical protein